MLAKKTISIILFNLQTSTILIRPLLESTPPNSGASLTSLNQDILTHGPSG